MRNVTDIYVLVDPIVFKVRYIGVTCQSLTDRLQNHIHDALYRPSENWHKARWIKSLIQKGKKPIIRRIAQKPTRKEAEELETMLIQRYKEKHNLVNISEDNGYFTFDGRKKASEINSKKVYVYHYDGTFYKEFDSAKEASEELGIYYSCVLKCLRGYYKYAKGFQFSFKKVHRMPDLTDYSTGDSVEIILKDNSTGKTQRFKSFKDCKDKMGIIDLNTNSKRLPILLAKLYGNKYSVKIGDTWYECDSTYYNTGVKVTCTDKEYYFKTKKDLIVYMGYSTRGILNSTLDRKIREFFPNFISVEYKLPLCQVIDKAN